MPGGVTFPVVSPSSRLGLLPPSPSHCLPRSSPPSLHRIFPGEGKGIPPACNSRGESGGRAAEGWGAPELASPWGGVQFPSGRPLGA